MMTYSVYVLCVVCVLCVCVCVRVRACVCFYLMFVCMRIDVPMFAFVFVFACERISHTGYDIQTQTCAHIDARTSNAPPVGTRTREVYNSPDTSQSDIAPY